MSIWRKEPDVEDKKVQPSSLSGPAAFCMCIFKPHKWGIFHRPLKAKIDFAEDIIKARVVLHNFVSERDRYNFDHILHVARLPELPAAAVKGGGTHAGGMREHCASYFQSSVTEVPWQYSKM